jgi:hypothetical protein
MPRYFFNFKDGRDYIDGIKYDLPNIKAAREHALKTSGEMLRGRSRAPVRTFVTQHRLCSIEH